jgi:nucleoid-associated protein YgaU
MAMPKPAAPAPTPAPVAAPPRIKAWHVVTSADTPSSITQKYYGTSDPAKWSAVYEVNKTVIGPDMNQLKPGLLLRIPEA